MDKRPIGIFDSGVGGLSVLKELVKLMPQENYIFVADQINIPYGEKTKKELEKATLKICDFLVSKNSKIIVAACNTATCYAVEFLRTNVMIPIIGTVPAIKPAAEESKSGTVAVMSTPATSKSVYLKKLIKIYANGTKVVNVSCPDLENAIETGALNSSRVRELLLKYTKPIKRSRADILVLGCTHYPFLKPQIKKIIGKNVKLFDSGKAIAKHAKEILRQTDSFNNQGGKINFYTTGNPDRFSKIVSLLLKRPVEIGHLVL